MGYGGVVKDPEFVGLLFWAARVVRLGGFFLYPGVWGVFFLSFILCTHAHTRRRQHGGDMGPLPLGQ